MTPHPAPPADGPARPTPYTPARAVRPAATVREPHPTTPARPTRHTAVREPAGREPVVREPAGREPVVREPSSRAVSREPAGREPVVREPSSRAVVREPAVREPVGREPVGDDKLIAGVIVVAVMLTGGRWLSHMQIGPLYIGDILLAAAFLHALWWTTLSAKRHQPLHRPGIALALLLVVTGAHLLTVDADLRTAARDAAPFVYAAIAYLAAGGYQRVGEHGRRRTIRLLHIALVLHLAWMAVATLAPAFVATLPEVGRTRVFEIRTDFDVAVLGILAGLSILKIRRGRVWLHASLAAAALVTGLAQVNRAGLFSCCACVLVATLFRARGTNGRITPRAVLLAVTALLTVIVALPMSPAGQRLLALGTDTTAAPEVVQNAQGTTRARLFAWERVVTYTLDDPTRTAVGVGFGPDFLQKSDGDLPIGRGMGVRSPHNYLITVFARLGVVGLVLIVSILAGLLAITIRTVRTGPPDELTALCVLLVVSLLIVALLGVILESPFGAAPFFWAAGILLAGDRSRRGSHRRTPEQKTSVSSSRKVMV
ncbi:O-antigen ligase family protein [Streptomyces sp. NPDC047971]|uniref:O-antigen ligase family protein n=1 Tax=Streptomyces sp. NPDC047971 TaxID=3154499 RepID=UPI00340CEDCF